MDRLLEQKLRLLEKAIEEKRIILINYAERNQKEEECKNCEDIISKNYNSKIKNKLKDFNFKLKNNSNYINQNKKYQERKEKEKNENNDIKFYNSSNDIERKKKEQNEDLEIVRQRYSQDIEINLKNQMIWAI